MVTLARDDRHRKQLGRRGPSVQCSLHRTPGQYSIQPDPKKYIYNYFFMHADNIKKSNDSD